MEIHIGSWTVHPDRNQITGRDARTTRVEPKTMEVIVYLASRAGEVVSRDELMGAVWPDVVVSDGTLNRCISQLRKAFGDSARNPRIIETIHKKGYRLAAPVRTAPLHDSTPDADEMPAAQEGDSGASRTPAGSDRSLSLLYPFGAFGVLIVVLAVLFLSSGKHAGEAESGQSPAPQTLPLTAQAGLEFSAAVSERGDLVAYISRRPGNPYAGLFVKNIGADSATLLGDSTRNAQYPAWIPGEHELAYFSCDTGFECGLFRISTYGQDERHVAEGIHQPWGLTVSPDGEYAIYSSYDDSLDAWQLFSISLTDGKKTRFFERATSLTGRGDLNPVISPDGERVVFKRSVSEGVADLYVASTDGTDLRRLTNDSAAIAGQTWYPDSNTVLFSSSRNGVFQLWSIGLDDGTPVRLAEVAARDPGFPVLSRDGSRLVFEEWDIQVNLVQVPLGADAPEAVSIVDASGINRHPAVSPDGEWIAYISNRSGTSALWRSRSDGTDALKLTDLPESSVGAPAWSPDSRHIAFEAFSDGQADIWVTDIQGSPPERITSNPENDRTPGWSRDGSKLYFSSNRTGSWQIWAYSLDNRQRGQITTDGGRRAIESVDGRTLFVSRFQEPGIWAVDLADGAGKAVRKLTSALASMDWANWAVSGSGIVLVTRSGRTTSLHLLDTESGTLTEPGARLDGLILDDPGLSVSPDGEYVIYASTARQESDLAYVEHFDAGR